MTLTALPINAVDGEPVYTARQTRQAFSALMAAGEGPLRTRSGFRPGGTPVVTVTDTTWTVGPFSAIIDAGASTVQAPYLVASDADESGQITPPHDTWSRRDILYVQVSDADEDGSGDRKAEVLYLAGTASATPEPPDTPSRSLRIGVIDVPPVGGGSPVFRPDQRFAVAAGGIVPVASGGDLAAGVAGRYRDRLDTGILERDTGTEWVPLADPALLAPWKDYSPMWTTTGESPTVGNGILAGRYLHAGRLVICTGRIVIGSTTNVGTGDWRVTLPVPSAAVGIHIGAVSLYASVPASNRQAGVAWLHDSMTMRFSTSFGGEVSATVPFAWSTNDQLRWTIVYEAAG